MRSLQASLVVLVLVVGGLAGCGGSGGGSSAPHAATRRVSPVHVVLSEAGEKPSSGAVGPAGGHVAAVAADGTRYDLAVPKGALASAVTIRVTPVGSIAGLPNDTKLAFAVDLAPHGLLFRHAAWLSVRPAAPVAVRAGLAIDDTNVASLAPIGHNAHGYFLAVAHFSGTGGVNLPGGFGPWPNLQPGGPIAGAIQNSAISAGGPITVPATFPPPPAPTPDPGTGTGSGSGLTGGSGASGSSSTSDPTLSQDLSQYLQQLADDQLTGGEGSDAERAALVQRIERVIDELAAQCVNGMDPTKIVDILGWQARGMLLGMDDDSAQSDRQSAIVAACTRFELVASGKLFFDAPPVFHIGDAIDATVPLELSGIAHEGSASAPIQPTGYDRGGELLDVFAQGLGMAAGVNVPNNLAHNDYVHCTTDPGTIRVDALAAGLYKTGGPKLSLSFATTRQSSVSCDANVGTFQMPPFVTMTDMLQGLGVSEATASGFLLTSFQRSGTAKPYAHEEIHKELSVGQGSLRTDWTFTINFAPGKLPPPVSGTSPAR